MLALPPLSLHEGRQVIVREFPSDVVDECHREARRSVSCRTIDWRGVIIQEGGKTIGYAPLVLRIRARRARDGWRFALIGHRLVDGDDPRTPVYEGKMPKHVTRMAGRYALTTPASSERIHPMLNITSLTKLTTATAVYETAWRNRTNDVGSNKENDARMQGAYQIQVDALAHLGVDDDTARAIHGAIIAACASVHGDRPRQHRNLKGHAEVDQFIRQVVAVEAGV